MRGNGALSVYEAMRGEVFSDGVARFYAEVIPAIIEAKAKKQRPVIVFDLDNTLFDTRWRTLEAARRYGEEHGIEALANATIDQIGADGRHTCELLGLGCEGAVADGFHGFWEQFFWDAANWHFDRKIEITTKMLEDAKNAGAEIFYLTGRVNRPGTLDQIKVLPDGDDTHLITKPRVGLRTHRFKAKELRGCLGTDPKCTILGFVSEGRRDIRHIQRNTKVPVFWFDFPVDREGHALAKGTPAIAWGARAP